MNPQTTSRNSLTYKPNTFPLLVRAAMLFCCLSATSLVAQSVDVDLSLSSDDPYELEDEAITLTATLEQAVNSDVEIALEFSGSATYGLDYEAETKSITIAEGELKGSTRIIPIRDWESETAETITISIDSISGASSFEAGDDVEAKLQDVGAMPIEKNAIGTSLFLAAYFDYTKSEIKVDTIVFNIGGVSSSETKLFRAITQER